MKKIAIVSDYYYTNIDFQIIPILSDKYLVGWFPFFDYSISESNREDFLNKVKAVSTDYFSFIRLSDRMRSRLTRKELSNFIKVVRKYNPDAIYVNADGVPWLPLIIKKYLKKIPIVEAIHDVTPHSGSGFVNRVCKAALPKFYKNLNTYSDYCYKQLCDKYQNNSKKKITCCHHPFTDFGVLNKMQHERFTVLFFGNILAYKGLPLLLESGKRAYEQNSKICIKIVGKGSDDYLLKPYINHPGFNIINRRIDDSEIPEVFSDVDCLALPYTDATQSGPMMIALNYGIPVFATDIPAFKEYDEKFSLVKLIKNEAEEWTKKIVEHSNSFPYNYTENEVDIFLDEIENERYKIQQEWISLFDNLLN